MTMVRTTDVDAVMDGFGGVMSEARFLPFDEARALESVDLDRDDVLALPTGA
ncbi:hypothetical protein [Amycolatopsis pigmentata]|uniref:Uncharacterized protein n=1 Tax=Amycolatopsis pigmentata TaxID=450801 RepID=A0ABW5FS85_9PSEU